jgi:hypothetical protein
MYPRNRKKRTFFSPGTEEKGKRRRDESTDDPEVSLHDFFRIHPLSLIHE